jgi:N-acetylglucosaminyldiphosphoundecaprenol N-acetyl-beta-D-mannosaminyltransferase
MESLIDPLPPKLNVLGIGISRLDYDLAVRTLLSAAKQKKSFGMTALAVHGLMEGFLDPRFAAQLNRFDLVTPDGQPVRWAMNLLGAKELKERVYGPRVTALVCEAAAKNGVPIFLYGSHRSVLEKLEQNLRTSYPGIRIAGAQADRFREATPEEDQMDIQTIRDSGAGIVLVGRGCPRQEKWVFSHLGKIDAVMMAVGAAFDFISGNKPAAPKFMQDIGCEWLFRLVHEPGRLWKRYLFLNPLYIFHVTLQILKLRRYPLEKS